MNAAALNQSSNDIASALESLRDEAIAFADRLHVIQARWNLQGFDAHNFFENAVKEAYDRLRDAFLGNRMRFGKRPSIEDYEVKRDFIKGLDCRREADLSTLDIKAAVNRAMDGLNVLLPVEDAENEVNRQLAARFVSEFHIERKEVVQRAGAVVLDYRASIDSIDKKYSKRNTYSYYTVEWLCKQISVLQDMVIHFNRNTEKSQPTAIPSYHELQQQTRDVSRSPIVISVCGFKLKVMVSKYEFHLSPEFAEYISEFISLNNGR
jgi:hypothetical protein